MFKIFYIACKCFLYPHGLIFSLNPETRDDFSITSNTEESEEEDENDVYSLEFVTQLFGDGKIFRSYVLLERLSPHDIQNLL